MPGSTVTGIVVVIALILAAVAAYTIHNSGGTTGSIYVGTGNITPGNEEGKSTGGNATSTTSEEAPMRVKGTLNINIQSGGSTIKITEYDMTIIANNGTISIQMALPNPCYNASLRYIESNSTLLLVIKSPPPTTACIQVLKPVALSTNITPPPSGEITLKILLDDNLVREVNIPVSP